MATGVALITSGQESAVTFCENTQVWFTDLSDAMIEAYLRTREPFDKAGGYGIQGYGGAYITKIDGCFFTVMGLPMHRLGVAIAKLIEDSCL